MSLCYYCAAIANTTKGTMIIASGIENEKAEIPEKATLKELEGCKNAEITDDELNAAKMAIITSSKSIYDDYGSLISWYFAQLFRKHSYSPEEYAALVVKADKADIARVASSYKLHTVYLLKGTAKEEDSE
jgi:predicted Zn-dependent peptidase